jgi:hypothetical protein
MSASEIKCLRCSITMEEGYLADGSYGATTAAAKWVDGAPDVRWYGVKTKGHDQIPLSTYRCASCGYVEFRAIAARDT